MNQNKNDRVHIDLEELVENYIWREYKASLGYPKRIFCRRSQYCIDIRWGFAEFKHSTEHTVRDQDEQRDMELELYSAEYRNETNRKQIYRVTASRQTTAGTRIELQENYTIGTEANLEVNFCGLITAGGGVNGSFAVTNTKEETFEETVTWEVNMEITVPREQTAKASLNVKEKPCVIDFTTITFLSLPKGKLPVTVRRLKDRKERTFNIENLSAVFNKDTGFDEIDTSNPDNHLKSGIFEVYDCKTDYYATIVKLVTRGVCRNTAFVDQHLEVKYLFAEDGNVSKPPKDNAGKVDDASAQGDSRKGDNSDASSVSTESGLQKDNSSSDLSKEELDMNDEIYEVMYPLDDKENVPGSNGKIDEVSTQADCGKGDISNTSFVSTDSEWPTKEQ